MPAVFGAVHMRSAENFYLQPTRAAERLDRNKNVLKWGRVGKMKVSTPFQGVLTCGFSRTPILSYKGFGGSQDLYMTVWR